jgi:hypothetical protein
MEPGMAGGLIGTAVGILGGVIGTYASIRNARGPRERAFVIRAAAVFCAFVTLFLLALGAPLFLRGSFPVGLAALWMPLLWAVYLPLLFLFIRRANDGHARARAEDEAGAGS